MRDNYNSWGSVRDGRSVVISPQRTRQPHHWMHMAAPEGLQMPLPCMSVFSFLGTEDIHKFECVQVYVRMFYGCTFYICLHVTNTKNKAQNTCFSERIFHSQKTFCWRGLDWRLSSWINRTESGVVQFWQLIVTSRTGTELCDMEEFTAQLNLLFSCF